MLSSLNVNKNAGGVFCWSEKCKCGVCDCSMEQCDEFLIRVMIARGLVAEAGK